MKHNNVSLIYFLYTCNSIVHIYNYEKNDKKKATDTAKIHLSLDAFFLVGKVSDACCCRVFSLVFRFPEYNKTLFLVTWELYCWPRASLFYDNNGSAAGLITSAPLCYAFIKDIWERFLHNKLYGWTVDNLTVDALTRYILYKEC